jgi:hypothetical protein
MPGDLGSMPPLSSWLVSARVLYAKAKPNQDRLQWYGHFLTLWQRDGECRWRVEFDGRIDYAARGRFFCQLERLAESREAYLKALSTATLESERRFLAAHRGT